MRVTKVVLGLAGFLLLSLIFVSFQAAAHPGRSDEGLANAPCAPVGGHISDEGWDNGVLNENSNFFDAIAHNPLCPIHGECSP